jgi:hypothetical protein
VASRPGQKEWTRCLPSSHGEKPADWNQRVQEFAIKQLLPLKNESRLIADSIQISGSIKKGLTDADIPADALLRAAQHTLADLKLWLIFLRVEKFFHHQLHLVGQLHL